MSRASAAITPTGSITEFPAGLTPGFSLLVTPGEIVEGSDGGLWFTETGAVNAIARIDQFGSAVTEHVIPDGTNPKAIAAGPDGALWFTEVDKGKLGRMTTDGAYSEYNLGLGGGDTLNDVTTGPDGKLWFTVANARASNKIGKLNPATSAVNLYKTT